MAYDVSDFLSIAPKCGDLAKAHVPPHVRLKRQNRVYVQCQLLTGVLDFFQNSVC